jgi:DNA-binding NtrC family response regulator
MRDEKKLSFFIPYPSSLQARLANLHALRHNEALSFLQNRCPVARILLIDDEPEFSAELCRQLEQLGHEVVGHDLAEDGLRHLANGKTDLVLLDNKMPRMSGLEFLDALGEGAAAVPVILMTSAHNDRTVIQAMSKGAFAYVIKPAALDEIMRELEPVLHEAQEITRRPQPVQLHKPDDKADADDSLIIGRSKPILEVLKRIGKIARTEETVLIRGETGTGKDLVGRAIHTNSARKHKPFVAINCTALNENLLDSELFGHEPEAFTGARKLRKGRFEHAHGGTLFLDEVGDMPLVLQAKLLRVLENKEITRVGSNDPIRVDVRVLAATHRDLKTLVRDGVFRQDLFYRLEGMTIHLPPLRQRPEDIELLAQRFLSRMFGTASAPTLDPAALQALRDYSWPGNIRQLQKVLCRAAGAARGPQIMPEELDFGELETGPTSAMVSEHSALLGLRNAIAWAWQNDPGDLWPLLQERLECELLRFALTQPCPSQVQLAKRLGIARNTLRARLKQYGLEEPSEDG